MVNVIIDLGSYGLLLWLETKLLLHYGVYWEKDISETVHQGAAHLCIWIYQ